jgi:hypothetical protein
MFRSILRERMSADGDLETRASLTAMESEAPQTQTRKFVREHILNPTQDSISQSEDTDFTEGTTAWSLRPTLAADGADIASFALHDPASDQLWNIKRDSHSFRGCFNGNYGESAEQVSRFTLLPILCQNVRDSVMEK